MSGLRTNSNNPTLKGGEKRISGQSSAPGSAAAPDKRLGREEATKQEGTVSSLS